VSEVRWSRKGFALLVLGWTSVCGCGASTPDFVVDGNARGEAVACVSATIASIRRTGISSPSINGPNTRALVRLGDGRTVQWDFMRSQRKDKRLREGDVVVVLLDGMGAASGVSRVCPKELGSPR
jgi:hypothetical protein